MANPHRRTLARDTTLHFFMETVTHDGRPRTVRSIHCSACPAIDEWTDSSPKGSPDELPAKVFTRRGWTVAKRADRDLCPTCSKPVRRPAPPVKPEGEPMSLPPIPITAARPVPTTGSPFAADPPRKPTPADRRAILDGLERHYNADPGRYAGDFSDAKLAEKLFVPRAWVTELREMIIGGPDQNEAADLKHALIAALDKRLGDMETAALEAMAAWDRDAKAIRADLAKLKG